jgi:hypothetical protein
MAQILHQDSPGDVRACKNTSGASLPVGTLVKIKASPTVPYEVEAATGANDPIYGVVKDAAIANGSIGDVQIRGIAQVLGSAAIAIGARVAATTAGKGVTASAGNAFCGIALTVGASGTLFEVELYGPGGAEMPG